jgi:hypothetical protein
MSDTECSICSEQFDLANRRKQMLPCLHKFCMQCIEDMVRISLEDSSQLKCFHCAEPFDDDKLYMGADGNDGANGSDSLSTIGCDECRYINGIEYQNASLMDVPFNWDGSTDQFVCPNHSALNVQRLFTKEIDDLIKSTMAAMSIKITQIDSFERDVIDVNAKLTKECESVNHSIKSIMDILIDRVSQRKPVLAKRVHAIKSRRNKLYEKVLSYRDPKTKCIQDAMERIVIDRDILHTLKENYDQLVAMIGIESTTFHAVAKLFVLVQRKSIDATTHPSILPGVESLEFHLEVPDVIDPMAISSIGYVGTKKIGSFKEHEHKYNKIKQCVDFDFNTNVWDLYGLIVDDDGFRLFSLEGVTIDHVACNLTATKFSIQISNVMVIFKNCLSICRYSLNRENCVRTNTAKLPNIPSDVQFLPNYKVIVTYKSTNIISCFTAYYLNSPIWINNMIPWGQQDEKSISVVGNDIYVNNSSTIFVLDSMALGAIIKQIPMNCANMTICPFDGYLLTYDRKKNCIDRYTEHGEKMTESMEFDNVFARSSKSKNKMIKSFGRMIVCYTSDTFTVYEYDLY